MPTNTQQCQAMPNTAAQEALPSLESRRVHEKGLVFFVHAEASGKLHLGVPRWCGDRPCCDLGIPEELTARSVTAQ
eukprot:7491177-Pyramimonas_sp.AAC.1